jgi:hypothetical protein
MVYLTVTINQYDSSSTSSNLHPYRYSLISFLLVIRH